MNLLESLYYWGYSRKKKRVQREQNRLPKPVISIGNITVGGTGKTPAAIAVAEEARRRGYYPVILTRGFRGKERGPCIVGKAPGSAAPALEPAHRPSSIAHNNRSASLSLELQASPDLYGDEPVLMAERLKEVPVIKAADRYEGGLFALEQLPPQLQASLVFILDDGFQHWRLYRDTDIVLIDGSNPFGNRRLLPLGPLRGPLTELKDADIFIITKEKNDELGAELQVINPYASVFFSGYKAGTVKDARGKEIPRESLRTRKVFAFCGIGNPEHFRQTAFSLAGELCGFTAYKDHYQYRGKDLLSLAKAAGSRGCDLLMTTEKDMVKVRELPDAGMEIVYPEIDFTVDSRFFDELFQNL